MKQNNPLDTQVGGKHYKDCAIQPVEFIARNNLNFLQGCVVKRITRFNKEGGKGIQDLEKIKHEVDLLIAFECEAEVKAEQDALPKIGDLVVVKRAGVDPLIAQFAAYIDGAILPVIAVTPTPENVTLFNRGADGYSVCMWDTFRLATEEEIATFMAAHNLLDE